MISNPFMISKVKVKEQFPSPQANIKFYFFGFILRFKIVWREKYKF